MKSVLLIGLGRFGRHMAEKLLELRHEVLAVDRNEERVNEILPLVTTPRSGTAPTNSLSSRWAFGTLICASWPSVTIFKVPWKPPRF